MSTAVFVSIANKNVAAYAASATFRLTFDFIAARTLRNKKTLPVADATVGAAS